MKEVLSVFTFGIGALCFVVFVTLSSRLPSVQSMGRASPSIAARTFRLRTSADRTSLQQRQGLSTDRALARALRLLKRRQTKLPLRRSEPKIP